ncbi:MAG: glycoside hydrolase [Chloroflexi bacterium]|nr:glycoside hydrolase [Chloroflexota bacterium]
MTHTSSPSGTPADPSTPLTVYYVDGYHGGVAGHMPLGAVRDVLQELRYKPWWKVSLEVEPFSWEYLRRRDPEVYRWLQEALKDQQPEARLEMVSGAYAQPFCWAFGGESNIRQLIVGRQVIHDHFPEATVDTYAVQEPCWTSCLPQVLRSLGYVRAVLKNPSTAWGGYTVGRDASIVNWVGPDGTAIPTVPRYACEELRECWRTESVQPDAEFAAKCAAHGIAYPTGMCFQDLGWPAHPAVDDAGHYISPATPGYRGPNWPGFPEGEAAHVRFVTWREYFQRFAPHPEADWRFSQEDIRVALCWGASALQTLAQQVRSAENRILTAEKMAAMASWMSPESGFSWPDGTLREAWRQLLMAQHHDAWIVLLGRQGREQWAWLGGAQTWVAERLCDEIIATAQESLALGSGTAEDAVQPSRERWVRVTNTLGCERTALAEVPLVTDPGTQSVRVRDGEGCPVPCQIVPSRQYGDGSLNAGSLLFRADTPSMGYAAYCVEPSPSEQAPTAEEGVTARKSEDGAVVLESDLYRITLDPQHGGVVTSLYAKALGMEFVDAHAERRLNEYRGYFADLERWLSSADAPAEVSTLESGPVRARVQVRGRIGDYPFVQTLSLVQGQRRIDCSVRFEFPADVRIGEPWTDPNTRATRRRPCYDDHWKLQAFFPAAAAGYQVLYKNAAYDVCRSENVDTFFNSWDEIKHNIILNWVDVLDEREEYGLALFSDHTTSYAHGAGYPLALVLGWSGYGLWGRYYPLQGPQQVQYALLPHRGRWDQAALSLENAQWCEPLLSQWATREPEIKRCSWVSVSGEGVEIPTMFREGERLFMRLFNAEGDDGERTLSLAFRPASVDLVELDGRPVRPLNVFQEAAGRWAVRLALPRFAIRTLCIRKDQDR